MGRIQNLARKLYKSILLITVFAAAPIFLAANFEQGCYLCPANQQSIKDVCSGLYADFAVTANGHLVVIDEDQHCMITLDTALCPQGLNAIDIGISYNIVTAGNNGKIYKAYHLSYHIWSPIASPTSVNLNDVGTGCNSGEFFIVGDSGVILKSTNDGQTFFMLNSGTTHNLNEVYCSEQNIRVAGDSNITLYSTNGGSNWIAQYVEIPGENNSVRVDLQTVFFVNPNTGWLAGNRYIFKTTNAGLLWIVRYKQTQLYNNYSNSIYFYNNDSGIVVGNHGDVQFSTNGGNNWFYSPNIQNLTTKNLNKFAYDRSKGYALAVGDSGAVIYKDSITLAIEPVGNIIPNDYKLYQNYPNPFNPETEIKFDISKTARVKLILFDALGNVISTLVDEKLPAGTYKVSFNGNDFASGTYFYKLIVNNYSESRKMVLLK